jgi:hypothetical protein
MINSEFMNEVKAALASLTIKIERPLMQWDNLNNRLHYNGNENDKLVPMLKNANDEYIKTKKYCK